MKDVVKDHKQKKGRKFCYTKTTCNLKNKKYDKIDIVSEEFSNNLIKRIMHFFL